MVPMLMQSRSVHFRIRSGLIVGAVLMLVIASSSAAWATQASATPNATGQGAARAAQPDWFEVPGLREFSGQLIVRPVQTDALREAGVTGDSIQARRADARREVSRYEIVRYVTATDEFILATPAGVSEVQVARSLMATGRFEYAEPDWLLSPLGGAPQGPSVVKQQLPPAGEWSPSRRGCPDDAQFLLQWHHQDDRLESCLGWALHTGRPRETVTICDTGVRTTHEDLLLHRLEGYNAVDRLWESQGGKIGPVYHHGTRVTGTAAANGDNAVGVVGVGWDLSHRMVRVSNISTGNAFASDIQHGARIAAERGDRVISVSYAGVSIASNKTTATYIRSLGGLLLWGAGNEGANLSSSNRDDDDLLVVGATDVNEARAFFTAGGSSNYGTFIDFVAPGKGIWTTDSGSDTDYASAEGTSFSCPLAAGLCALIWSQRPSLSAGDVERIVKLAAQDIGAPGLDDVFGYGRIHVASALSEDWSAVPVADFSAVPTSGLSPLPVSFLDQSTGIPTSWAWDFGDGATSSVQHPAHTYTASGAYTVSLTVTNDLGLDSVVRTDLVLVDVIPPVAQFSGTPTAGLSPLTVDFTDESASQPNSGVPTTWAWDFGDGGTSTAQHPSYIYTAPGLYTVTLTASNPYGFGQQTRTGYIAVDVIPPAAAFMGTPTVGASPLVVDFTDQSTMGVATAWQWSFGDGASSSLQHPQHTYTVAGSYNVSLMASNAYGSDSLVKPAYVQIGAGPAIVSNFEGTPLTGAAPLQVTFTDLSIGNATSWYWQFGDGTTSTEQNPVHVYTAPGEYDVALEVANGLGDDDCLELGKYIVVQ